MICPECNNSILSPSLPVRARISYRGFEKEVGSLTYLGCSSCPYESTDSQNSSVGMVAAMIEFKREINVKLSIGEELC